MLRHAIRQQRNLGSSNDCVTDAKKISFTTHEFRSICYQNLNRPHTHTWISKFRTWTKFCWVYYRMNTLSWRSVYNRCVSTIFGWVAKNALNFMQHFTSDLYVCMCVFLDSIADVRYNIDERDEIQRNNHYRHIIISKLWFTENIIKNTESLHQMIRFELTSSIDAIYTVRKQIYPKA